MKLVRKRHFLPHSVFSALMGKSSSSVCLLLLCLLFPLAAFNFLMIMRFLFLLKKHQTSTFARQRDLRLWLKCAIGDKSLKNIDKNKTKARQVEKREATEASQTHKRQAKRRDEWTLLPQIYWPGPAKAQLRPPGLQFRPLPPSNPVISRDAWGQGESWDVVCVLKHNELRNILDSVDKVSTHCSRRHSGQN